MNKKTVIISSIMLVVVLVSVLVGVSAAWFGDVNKVERSLVVDTARFGSDSSGASGSAGYDIESGSAIIISSSSIQPASMVPGYFTGNKGNVAPSGAALLSSGTSGMLKPATSAIIYIPLSYKGSTSGDVFYSTYKRVGVTVRLTSATTLDPTTSTMSTYNYIEYFNVDLSIVRANTGGAGYNEAHALTINTTDLNAGTTTPYYESNSYTNITTGATNYKLEMLIVPESQYYLKAVIYFATVDDETPAELLDQTIFFNFSSIELGTEAIVLPGSGS